MAAREHLARAAALAYRAVVHEVEQPARAVEACAVLAVGVQDTPPGTTAARALAARLPTGTAVEITDSLALVHSMRGTMHLHRVDDLDRLAAALRPDDAADLQRQAFGPFFADTAAAGIAVGEAFDEVSGKMSAVMSDGAARSKGELSTALNDVVDERLRPWCAGCGVAHVHDGLFRLATLPAGLRLSPLGDGSAEFVYGGAPLGGGMAADDARRELVRRYMRFAGPADREAVAAWLGVTPAAARRWWSLVADDLVPVDVEGRRLAMHRDDLADARAAARPSGVRLLPPYDPMLEVADRRLVVPDDAGRKALWRAVANPGAVLVAGEIVGAWRRRQGVVTVTAFGKPLPPARRAEIQQLVDGKVVFD
jgi:hypothetical protein